MQARGFSLVEMVLVLAVIAILLSIGTLRFRDYALRSAVEAQTRGLYSELSKARAKALFERRTTRFKLYADHFEVYSSVLTSDTTPVLTRALRFPITWNSGSVIDFDEKGITTNWCSICVDASDAVGAVDSVVVDFIKQGVGKKDKGSECKSPNITIH